MCRQCIPLHIKTEPLHKRTRVDYTDNQTSLMHAYPHLIITCPLSLEDILLKKHSSKMTNKKVDEKIIIYKIY